MTTTTDLETLLLRAAESPAAEPLCCQVAADYCEDHGHSDLAYALRWAAWAQLRPERRDNGLLRWLRPLRQFAPTRFNSCLQDTCWQFCCNYDECWQLLASDLAAIREMVPPLEQLTGSSQ